MYIDYLRQASTDIESKLLLKWKKWRERDRQKAKEKERDRQTYTDRQTEVTRTHQDKADEHRDKD